jgi:hypothetical protein
MTKQTKFKLVQDKLRANAAQMRAEKDSLFKLKMIVQGWRETELNQD